MSRTTALAFVAFALSLAACSERPVVVRAVPDDARSLRVFYNLAGAVDVPEEHVYETIDGRIAVEDLPPDATLATPLLSVEARGADGCLLANAATSGFEVRLRPVLDCGRPAAPVEEERVPGRSIRPELPVVSQTLDSDGDGVPDVRDQCPTEDSRFRGTGDGLPPYSVPDPARPGCLAPDSDGDGYPDPIDDCPTFSPGPFPGRPGRGCPDTKCPIPPPEVVKIPMGTSDVPVRILDATPLQLPAGERRRIVVRVVGLDARFLSRVDNYAGSALDVYSIGAVDRSHALLEVRVRTTAPMGALADLVLYFGSTKLRLEGLEVVEAPTRCE